MESAECYLQALTSPGSQAYMFLSFSDFFLEDASIINYGCNLTCLTVNCSILQSVPKNRNTKLKQFSLVSLDLLIEQNIGLSCNV